MERIDQKRDTIPNPRQKLNITAGPANMTESITSHPIALGLTNKKPDVQVSITELPSTPTEEQQNKDFDNILATLDYNETHTLSRLDPEATHIQSSPYADPSNHLHLSTLDLQPRLFALALTTWHNTVPNYATAPYLEAFNWVSVFRILRALCARAGVHWQRQEFYTVIFRSKLQRGADRVRLGELDKMSHAEACASGGLLVYWFGSPDEENRNLASCIWRNREDAAAGGKGPWHKKARGAAREMYESISFHTHTFVIEDGALEWRLEEYRE